MQIVLFNQSKINKISLLEVLKLCYFVVGLTSFLFLFVSCQTYTKQNQQMREEMYDNNLQAANQTLDSSDVGSQTRNFALFHMEKGMLLYLLEQYQQSSVMWIKADKHLDDLYTTSISKTAESFAINDSMSDYEGEVHERLLLPIFTSIGFFANNNLNNAQVMIRRAYDISKNLQQENSGKNLFKYDAFTHYFSGMVYESKNDWDNAIVEYRLAFENIKNENTTEAQVQKKEIFKSLGRLAQYRNRTDILNFIRKENPDLKWESQSEMLSQGEVFIIYEAGKSPIKEAEDIYIPIGNSISKISFPKYTTLPYISHYADILVDNNLAKRTVIMENIGQMAQQALADRKVRDIAKMTARIAAKSVLANKLGDENPYAGIAASLFNIFSEVADTRSWTSLPDSISVARVLVPVDKDLELVIKPQFGVPKKISVKLHPGEKKLFRFRTFN
jgi:hypothetical protein